MASERAQDTQAAPRAGRLLKLFVSFTKGNRAARTPNDGKLLLEAICNHGDASECIERVVASDNAMNALRLSLRFDNSPTFINSAFKDFTLYLQDPLVKQLANGLLYREIVTTIVQPATLWQAIITAHVSQQLGDEANLAFAHLLVDLLSWTERAPLDVTEVAKDITTRKTLLSSEHRDVRSLGYRIQHILQIKGGNVSALLHGPGGRHDNDFSEYRKISIFPTVDELLCKEKPFLRRADSLYDEDPKCRVSVHLDSQFRLLREDFLAELRDDLEASRRGKKSRRPGTRLRDLSLAGSYCGKSRARLPFALALTFKKGADTFTALDTQSRKAFLKDNPKFLKHQSFGVLLDGGKLVAFGTLSRVEELLLADPPAIALHIRSTEAIEKALGAIKTSSALEFILVDTSVFAYEPILQCLQSKLELPLGAELLGDKQPSNGHCIRYPSTSPVELAEAIEDVDGEGLQAILDLPHSVNLDESQTLSLLAGLRQSVSLIQGPPGTGKSFIGALLAKALHDHTDEKILVMCYTNHALDQFLEDLLDIGIAPERMVRLGAKSTPRTKQLSLSELPHRVKLAPHIYDIMNRMDGDAETQQFHLGTLMAAFVNFQPSKAGILEFLEFSEDDSDFFDAFEVPASEDGEQIVGRRGKLVGPHYLYDQWCRGHDAGVFKDNVSAEHEFIWRLDKDTRMRKLKAWHDKMMQEMVSAISAVVKDYAAAESDWREMRDQRDAEVMRTRQIIACTTTAAAKYTKHLQNAAPGIVLVEEAGEILESHILTAMTPSTKQLILIGDHQQLRPKVNNHLLSVERGKGYDLNRSLFERLVIAGYPHTTLHQQHRMCPEISSLVRDLAYPHLIDAPSTERREALRGLRTRVVFIDHRCGEVRTDIVDRRDEGASNSKRNAFEASMVLKIVRYLAQQGYGTSDQVVLTPYLGQLSLLLSELSRENDPVLNDLDSFDLIRAGALTRSSASQTKKPIKISTIDNYQGEESDIVIVSLTRSNPDGDIGFMASPERLNVLLSRARKGLIVIGDSKTFKNSRKGASVWQPLFTKLAEANAIFGGLPVRCERHPDTELLLREPTDFDEQCPEGGCSALCGKKLMCGLHVCLRKCHKPTDHSKERCDELVSDECPRKHKLTWRCSTLRPATCRSCDEEGRIAAQRQQRDTALDRKRQELQDAYAAKLADVQIEIDKCRQSMKERREAQSRERTLQQHQKDLESVRVQAARLDDQLAQQQTAGARATTSLPTSPMSAKPTTQPQSSTEPPQNTSTTEETSKQGGLATSDPGIRSAPPSSAARADWEHQKQFEDAKNDALDALMDMIGLENVKDQFLEIKSRVDLAIRQDTDVTKDRFGAALLGNPGTGKTTVARLYAKFLTSVGALPGSFFVETTGARLANEGVQGCKKMLDDILNNGGGALFIDEAYQLTTGSSHGGAAVLDFLLAEVENLTGKVVFILAGYNKQMESFFAHNPGIPSRFPREIQFGDYEDSELLEILNYGLNKRYDGRMEMQNGSHGLYARIVARRVGRGRGKAGFGNARAVENALAAVLTRQAKRVRKARRNGSASDDMVLSKEDLIGVEPSGVLDSNPSWKKLLGMTGLASVKDSVKALFSSIDFNYRRELEEQPLIDFTLNKVFLGSPGTGKTTVAKLYGQILADIGLLSSGEVVVRTPADFVGNVLGGSEANTKGILDAAVGKVLVIDEAYGLYAGGGGGTSDPYRTAVIDTIVAEVQSVPGDDRCVLLLGYKEQMEEMMQHVNPGLRRRFPPDSGFFFEDFDDDQMAIIFDAKLKALSSKTTPKAREVAVEMLKRARNRPNFGNAGEVDILLNDAKIRQQKRVAQEGYAAGLILEAHDFDPDFARGERAVTNVAMLFKDVVGCDDIIAQLQGYQQTAANMKARGMDPREQLPFTFLFRGPPGTGKTSTARRMGKVYYDMGFLAKAEVLECSAKDMVAEYVGQTGPKTQKLVESALGKVLFIDEAYRLSEGPFAKEAIDELVDCVTKPQFAGKVVIILAGYENDINLLMDANPGLTSRFPEAIDFRSMTAEESFTLLVQLLVKRSQIDSTILSNPRKDFRQQISGSLNALCTLGNFASARDIETLAKGILGKLMKTAKPSKEQMILSEDLVLEQAEKMINERTRRAKAAGLAPMLQDATALPLMTRTQTQQPSAPQSHMDAAAAKLAEHIQDQEQQAGAQETATQPKDDDADDDNGGGDGHRQAIRDVGVSDAVWDQLQKDKLREEEEKLEVLRLQQEEARLRDWLKKCADAKRALELAEIERRRKELEEKRKREAMEKQKLTQMGRCPVGYAWIKQAGGYRCAGGSHWMSEGEVSKLCDS